MDTDIPLSWIAAVIGIPIVVTLILGWASSRSAGRNVYRCQRCGTQFSARAYRGFPPACPSCGARDWPTGA